MVEHAGEAEPAPSLPGDAYVVRFGMTDAVTFMNAIKINPERRRQEGRPNPDVPNISVVCRAGLATPDEVLALTLEWPGWEGKGAPHGKVQHASVAALRERGFDVVADEPPPGHALVTFDHVPTEEDRVNLLGAFEALRDNPLKRNLGMGAADA